LLLASANDSAVSATTMNTPAPKYGEMFELLEVVLEVVLVEIGVPLEMVVITLVVDVVGLVVVTVRVDDEDEVVVVWPVVVESVEEVVDVVVEEVVDVVDDVLEEVVDEVVLDVVEEVELLVDPVETDRLYTNVAVPEITGPEAPHVALIRYCPMTHWDVPPVTSMSWNAPVVALTEALATMTRTAFGLYTLMNTAVLLPGAGEMVPLMIICWVPE
jgi:hypothetical protein